ncbi:hypothetical protein M0Q39_03825 [Patescibacteria group bacterium]|nr:hypothetical protein [Patescibacteria group bacterium]
MKKEFKILIYSLAALLFIFIALFFLIPNKCENDFKAYPEKGYCEFSLKNCEGLFGCKEYNNVQVPCDSVSTLCGKKILCDCGNLSINEAVNLENKDLFIVSGDFVCLPVKNQDEPHNDLCVFGVKNNDGDYYRLQAPSDDKNNVVNKIRMGQKIEISGELINEESEIYTTLGTIKVEGVKHLYTEEGNIESNLPDSFKASYISFQNYGSNVFNVEEYPKLESWVENSEIECDETPLESSLPLRISKRQVNGQKYCIGASSEGAVGSVYTQYAYTTVIEDNVYLVQFVARYPNCSNYPDKERGECEAERENFNLDNLVDFEVRQMKN